MVNNLGLNPTNLQVSHTNSAKTIADAKEDAKLKAACKDLEAVFLNILMTQMRKTVPKDELYQQSSQQDIMQSMMDEEMTKSMSGAGGIGLADMLYRQLSHKDNLAPAVKGTNKSQASS